MTPTRPDPRSTDRTSGNSARETKTWTDAADRQPYERLPEMLEAANRRLDPDPLRPSEEQAARMWSGIQSSIIDEAYLAVPSLDDGADGPRSVFDYELVWFRQGWFAKGRHGAAASLRNGRREGFALGLLLGLGIATVFIMARSLGGAAVLLAWTWFR